MPKKKTGLPLRNKDDSHAMRNAIAWCAAQGLPVRRVSPHQIKVGPYNFYPNPGTFNRDDIQQKQTGGFESFRLAVAKWWKAESEKYRKNLDDK